MKRFIDILKTRDLARFRATLGILGKEEETWPDLGTPLAF
jgi:hypothetical protein